MVHESLTFDLTRISNVLMKTRATWRFVSLACSIYVLFSASFSTLWSTRCSWLEILYRSWLSYAQHVSVIWTSFQAYQRRSRTRSDLRRSVLDSTYFIQGSNRFWKAPDKDIWHNDKNSIKMYCISMQKPQFFAFIN